MKKKKSSNTESFYDTFESPIGTLYLLFRGKNLSGISYRKPLNVVRKTNAPASLKRELREYFEGRREDFSQEIEITGGTEFDNLVWLALREIPYGETRTYKWLAEKIGRPNSSRAVGQSLGRNPIAILIPCHRIIESDGSLGGYSGGVDIKRRLLDIEYYMKLEKKG